MKNSMKLLILTKYDKYKLLGTCIKTVVGIIGASAIFQKVDPFISVGILALGAVANEIVNFIKDKETNNNGNGSV